MEITIKSNDFYGEKYNKSFEIMEVLNLPDKREYHYEDEFGKCRIIETENTVEIYRRGSINSKQVFKMGKVTSFTYMTKEFKNLTETAVIYDKDNNSMKMEIKYKDNSLKNGTARSYTNNKLVQEMVFENSTAILLREYHDNGNLAAELPANGEAKTYYENGKVKESIPIKNGKREGVGKEYDETGKVIKETRFKR